MPELFEINPESEYLAHDTIPTPAPLPRGFEPSEYKSGIQVKDEFNFREKRNQEIEKVIKRLRKAKNEWKQRELLVKLANFLAETEYPDDLLKQAEKVNEYTAMVPVKGPIDPIIVNTFVGHAVKYLKVKRLMDKKKDMQEEDWAA
ncbi:MAG: hypothetical protein WCW31_05850 [Patescibacteria group bacterium]